ncbi:MAG: DNA replication and repair protein RecF [Opitutaceae bacterium]|nr:DNA replication and repair protein RecF [Opitutaceae bacterium]|tara:strand:- start:3448 stop:4527 length:1080 start_codon:yes stop_codon:yes gene_type:complete
MRISRLRLQTFRNISFVDLSFSGDIHFFSGKNAQGKTNLLEALGMVSALRSFRAHDINTIIKQGDRQAQMVYNIEGVGFKSAEVSINLKKKGKEIEVDGERISRFRDFIGSFPTVVMSSHDIQLLRGSPGVRRQWLNLVLASSNQSYYDNLRDYHRLLAERNALLKKFAGSNEMKAFEAGLADKAVRLFKVRSDEIPRLQRHLKDAYLQISPEDENVKMAYKPDFEAISREGYLKQLEKSREKDRILKSTQHGPHRDDLDLGLEGRKARDFGSEGQQRSLMIALKIAQSRFVEESNGISPVLLADDVLGELDDLRKSNFWHALGKGVQVFATGTEIPNEDDGRKWQVFTVRDGTFTEAD